MQDVKEKADRNTFEFYFNPFPHKRELKEYQVENRWTLLTENRVVYTKLLAETLPLLTFSVPQ